MNKLRWVLCFIILFAGHVTPTLAQQSDRDGDGLPDSDDQCPLQAGSRENRGCPTNQLIVVPPPAPPPDTDGDGVIDVNDPCPTVAGSINTGGCPTPANQAERPPADTDGDGLPDAADTCPTVPGLREHSGCPAENPGAELPTSPDTPVQPQPGGDINPGNSAPDVPPPPAVPPAPARDEFRIPWLSEDGCFVTPNLNSGVNIRREPHTGAEIMGRLSPEVLYPAQAYLLNEAGEKWYVLAIPGSQETGYAAAEVLAASTNCPAWLPSQDDVIDDGLIITAENPAGRCVITTQYLMPAIYTSLHNRLGPVVVFNIAPDEPIPDGVPPVAILNLPPGLDARLHDPASWVFLNHPPDVITFDPTQTPYVGVMTPAGMWLATSQVQTDPTALNQGVTVLAWARVDGVSPVVPVSTCQPITLLRDATTSATEYHVFTALCGSAFALLPGHPNGSSGFKLDCLNPANPQMLNFEVLDQLCGGEFAIIPGDPNGGQPFDLVCRNPNGTQAINFGVLDQLCGGQFVVILSDPNGSSPFDLECRNPNGTQALNFESMDQLCGGEFVILPGDTTTGGSFDLECRNPNPSQAINFDVLEQLCGGEFAIIPGDPNSGGTFDVECRSTASSQ